MHTDALESKVCILGAKRFSAESGTKITALFFRPDFFIKFWGLGGCGAISGRWLGTWNLEVEGCFADMAWDASIMHLVFRSLQ